MACNVLATGKRAVRRAVVLSTQELVEPDPPPRELRSKEIVRGVRLQLSEFFAAASREPGSRASAIIRSPSLFPIMD